MIGSCRIAALRGRSGPFTAGEGDSRASTRERSFWTNIVLPQMKSGAHRPGPRLLGYQAKALPYRVDQDTGSTAPTVVNASHTSNSNNSGFDSVPASHTNPWSRYGPGGSIVRNRTPLDR